MNMFGRAVQALKKIVGSNAQPISNPQMDITKLPLPFIVKRKFPRSCFTKKGTGVDKHRREALEGMTRAQRLVAKAKGWDGGMVCPGSGALL